MIMTERDTMEHARQNAQGWLESIQEMVARLEHSESDCDDEDCTLNQTIDVLDWQDYHDADAAREAIEESALSVELSGTWLLGEKPEADSFIILLTTGGPALRLCGDLNEYHEPTRAYLQMQDWGTVWTDFIVPGTGETLLKFAQCFYFGD